MSFESYKNKGLTGLANLGNTCYLNSCIQIFSHTYELNELFREISQERNLNNIIDSKLLIEWNNLYQVMWKENCTVAPYRFYKAIEEVANKKYKKICLGDQNDMPEFLNFMLDCFHKGLEKEVNIKISGDPKNITDKIAKVCYKMVEDTYSQNYSELIQLYFGIQFSKLTDLNGIIKSIKAEPFSILDIPIPEDNKNPTIIDCLDLYCKEELLEKDNAWYNEETKIKESVNKRLLFWSLPDILIISLKRFTNFNKKIHVLVNVPLDKLDLSKYVEGYNKYENIFELFAVCNHQGNCSGGHYFAYIKTASSKWMVFNDTVVKEVNENQIISNKSYCLFFRKIKK